MKRWWFIVVAALWANPFAETVVKSSVPFSFPFTGINAPLPNLGGEALFSGKMHLTGKSAVSLSWSLPIKAEKGAISLFSISGALVKKIAITGHAGSVEVDCTRYGIARGIYFATISYGGFQKTINFIVYR
jgi:hypothetical protein